MRTQPGPLDPRFVAYAPGAVEDLLAGGRILRRAFLEDRYYSAGRQTVILGGDEPEPRAILIQRGVAYRSCTLPDGRRAILDLLLPGDIGGLDSIVLGNSTREVTAANPVGYRAMSAFRLRDLMGNRTVALRVMGLMAEARWRTDRHLAAVCRLDARERIGVFLLDIHDRLFRAGLITRPTFNLALTQDQIADHLGMTMVHVNRTLRRMRDDRLVLVDRQVVIIMDIDRLRAVVTGLPPLPELPEPALVDGVAE
jgi:CRP/FNR family transcriptional regulator